MSTPSSHSQLPTENVAAVHDPLASTITMVWAVAVAGFVISMGFSFFLWQQSVHLKAQRAEQKIVLANIDNIQLGLRPMLQEIINVSTGNQELLALFAKYGIQVLPPLGNSTPATPPPHPGPASVNP